MSKKKKTERETGILVPEYPFKPKSKSKYRVSQEEIQKLKDHMGGRSPMNTGWNVLREKLIAGRDRTREDCENLSVKDILHIIATEWRRSVREVMRQAVTAAHGSSRQPAPGQVNLESIRQQIGRPPLSRHRKGVSQVAKNVKDRFSFTAGQVFYEDQDLQLPGGDTIDIMKKLVESFGFVVSYQDLDAASVNHASDRLRGIVKRINTKLKEQDIPCLVSARRAAGYCLSVTKDSR
jgi:hypothetical protein